VRSWSEAALDEEEEILAEIAELYGMGLDDDEIARTLHISLGLVRDVLREPTRTVDVNSQVEIPQSHPAAGSQERQEAER
jgi:DNA-binding NarL/FixJ family response regulator